MKTELNRLSLLIAVMVGLVPAAFGQLQWSSYDNTGNLVSANVASGGDAPYGGSVTFTIPAATQRIFMARNFVPVVLRTASSAIKVNFSMTANGGLYPGNTGRILGMGLLNDPGTPATALDDTGYWADFNTGNPSFELFDRPATVATFFQYDSADKLGTGKTSTGYPTNNVTYGMQFQLNMNSSATSISIGTSGSSWPNCGVGMTNGNGSVNQLAYSSGVALTALATTNFNEFAFMLNNTSSSNVNVTLSGFTLAPANPEIISQPLTYSGAAGSSPVFIVVVNPNAVTPIGYQWYETNSSGVVALTDGPTGNGSTISGSSVSGSTAFTNSLTFNNVQAADANGNIFVVITNVYGSVTSAPVAMIILPPTQPTNLVVTPDNVTVVAGHGTNFNVSSIASPSPSYYWYDNNGSLLQSGSDLTLALSNLQLANAGEYFVVASNYLGTATNYFAVNVVVPPCISQQPSNVLVNVGDPVNFYVVEGGCALPAPTYQWYKDGDLISGATATNYSIASVGLGDIGNYSVIISNAAGTISSATAKLAIYSTTLTGTPLLPANGGTGLCVDTPLQITFNQTPTVGNAGEIKIYDASNPATPVDTIDMSLNNSLGIQARSLFPGDSQAFNYYPMVVRGDVVSIYPHSGVLTTNKTYYVTLDPGVVVDSNGAYYPGISSSTVWQFSTKPTGPANPTNLVVDASGAGDFVTVQGAVDSIPLGNTNYTLINIRNGSYFEIVDIAGKNNVTFRGQSQNGTSVGYPNNANIAPGGSTHARMAFKVNANDIALDNLTITNMTPQGGSQAEALMIETGAARCIVNNCTIVSRQDTILANVNSSQGYFYKSTVLGNYDYIWGGGNLYFDQCVMETIAGASGFNLTAARTDTSATTSSSFPWANPGSTYTANGMSFVNCSFTADAGVSTVSLADANGTAGNNVSWYGCDFATNYIAPLATLFSGNFVFWQDLNTMTNSPVTFANVTSISGTDARLLAATNIPTWFYGWTPQLAPNILTNPVSQTVTSGASATFTVVATGIPDPTYQWFTNGVAVAGATSAMLIIPAATTVDADTYTVVVTTPAGSVTSSPATLTVNPSSNTAPVFTAPIAGTNIASNVGVNLAISCTATDADIPAQTLTYALLAGPSGAALDPSSGILTWRPTVTQANSSNPVSVSVTDNGTPNLSATNQFIISVNPLTPPLVASPSYAGGQFSVSLSGEVGPDYALQATTNLAGGNWITVATTNSPATMPVILSDPNAGSQPMQFYRTVTGPPLP